MADIPGEASWVILLLQEASAPSQTSLGRLVGLSYSFRRLALLPRIQAERRHRPATLGFAPPGGEPRGTAEKQHGPVPSTRRPFPISSEVPPEKLRACRALWSPGAPGPQPREWSRRQEEDDQALEPRKRGFLKLWVWSCVFVLRKLLLCAGHCWALGTHGCGDGVGRWQSASLW